MNDANIKHACLSSPEAMLEKKPVFDIFCWQPWLAQTIEKTKLINIITSSAQRKNAISI